MTDKNPADSNLAEQLSTTEKVALSLRKRHRKEKRFQWAGLMAVGLGFLLVVILISDIVLKARPAFHQHWVKLEVEFRQDWLGVTSSDLAELKKANYRSVLRRSLYGMFPDVKGRRDKRSLFKMISTNAEFTIKQYLLDTPTKLGKTAEVWVRFDDDIDSYLKDDYTPGEAGPRVSKQQAQWLQQFLNKEIVDKRWNSEFFTSGDSREPELAGVRGALTGTLLTMLVTLLLSFPLGVAAAIYLEEFAPKNRWTDIIEVNINNLAAVPSIIFGLLGLAVIINIFGLPRSAPLVGGIVLTLMTLPTIIIASRASIKAVPPSIREAALGLGASKMQTAFGHVLPMAMPGILTGTIIGMAQALGETAPLLMIGMVAFIVDVPAGVTDAATVLPVQIYLWADSPERAFLAKTSAAILVLLSFLLIMNSVAAILRKKFEKN
ncbi:phosphate ABC transporter permease PstA [Aliikangiella coralliicola]|uniref:Phosphate transport system permease protein PstA n=1 Tax=Aliikangiella coralliicola TaxID=2592383 RepID=A0A545UHJ7_9GAMM|nr:phosphate ABC transporter permease PstA [Aliikangiella coralliicola]TQV88940.1 phosphate ABC transporter permease PstA [Aliikangiella coralliicola]